MCTSKKPRVDVVIPAYNAAETIGEAIASVQAQTFADFGIIVIDDGSLDGTAEILQRLRASDRRVQVIRQDNGGIVEARNAGLRASTAEFLAVQDADDLSDPRRLSLEVDHLDRNPSCVAVSGSARHIDGRGAATGRISAMPPLDAADASWVPAREPYLMPFGLMRRSALDQVGGYRHVDYAEDTDLYWRLSRVGGLSNMPEVVGSYRYHPGSATGGGSLVNTRILAANNQLAAISAARRAGGQPDLKFGRTRLDRYREAGALAGIFAIAASDLDPIEKRRFKTAMAAKMLQWLEGRNIQPELEDCAFIHQAYDERPALERENEKELRRLYTVIGARLMRVGKFEWARALLPASLMPESCLRSVLGRC